jgi:hypothetical protein
MKLGEHIDLVLYHIIYLGYIAGCKVALQRAPYKVRCASFASANFQLSALSYHCNTRHHNGQIIEVQISSAFP